MRAKGTQWRILYEPNSHTYPRVTQTTARSTYVSCPALSTLRPAPLHQYCEGNGNETCLFTTTRILLLHPSASAHALHASSRCRKMVSTRRHSSPAQWSSTTGTASRSGTAAHHTPPPHSHPSCPSHPNTGSSMHPGPSPVNPHPAHPAALPSPAACGKTSCGGTATPWQPPACRPLTSQPLACACDCDRGAEVAAAAAAAVAAAVTRTTRPSRCSSCSAWQALKRTWARRARRLHQDGYGSRAPKQCV